MYLHGTRIGKASANLKQLKLVFCCVIGPSRTFLQSSLKKRPSAVQVTVIDSVAMTTNFLWHRVNNDTDVGSYVPANEI